MNARRSINRRSFLGRVAGGMIAGGGALALLAEAEGSAQTTYTGVNDCDQRYNTTRDRPGYGRGVRNAFTDSDTGPGSDPPCRGRGSNAAPGSGSGYNPTSRPPTGCSDSDYGQNGDPGGYGRSCRGGVNVNAPRVSGCTDRDPTDSIGNGRNCRSR